MTPEHEALRRIGGSDVAAVLGKSRWKSPLDVYLRLTAKMKGEPVIDTEMNENMKRGVYLEPGLRAWAGERLNDTFTLPEQKSLQWEKWEWATYSPDGLGERTHSLLEIKSPSPDSMSEWGREHTAEIPTEYLLQGAWGCMVTNRERCYFGALLGGELRIFEYVRTVKLENNMLARAKAFVEDNLLAGVPPEPTYLDHRNVYRLHPTHTEKLMAWDELRTDQRVQIADYLRLRASMDPVQKQMDSLEASILMTIGGSRGITAIPSSPEFGNVEKMLWGIRTGHTQWKAVAEHLAFGLSVSDEEITNLATQHKGEPTRALTLSRAKGTKR